MIKKEELKQIFQKRYTDIDFTEQVLRPVFGDRFRDVEIEDMLESYPDIVDTANEHGIVNWQRIGEIKTLPGKIDIFDITVTSKIQMHRNRISIQSTIHKVMRTVSSAFMIFHYETGANWDWRFTFYRKQGAENSDPKRYTFLLGPDQSCRTAAKNFMELANHKGALKVDDIQKAFDVEALSKEFFTKYKSHYERFCEYVYNNKVNPELFGVEFTQWEDKTIRDYVKKLLGRIVFLHFLQKKGWMGVPADKPWGEGDRQFMKSLFDKASDEQKANYLDDVLEPLFAEALDKDRRDDGDLFDTGVEGFRNVKIPYLNGGLFERDKMDEPKSTFSQELFADLFDFFHQYNFTIDENDPNDAEVGVDPEMLGRIFENLLEDNKDKGAFYTPKEIVQYMCRESLIAYLQTDVEDDATKQSLRDFVTTHEVSALKSADVDTVSQKLRDVKICDPAIGSGAFPMGLLKELFGCRMAIEGNVEAQTPAKIKKEIIQQSIYGVDIEKGAVDIARLRFWLSLIIDEQTPHALPNMDFKIMQGNSLLEQYKGFDLSHIMDTKKEVCEGHQVQMFEEDVDIIRAEIKRTIQDYYEEANHDQRRSLREGIRQKIRQQMEIQGYSVDISDISDIAANDQFFLWHTWFSEVFEKGGFDIVIGNPPYIRVQNLDHQLIDLYKKTFKTAWRRIDISTLFIEHLCSMLSPNGILCYITSNQFVSAEYGRQMRKFLIKNTLLSKVVDFAGLPVFDEAITYVSIFIINATKRDSFQYFKVPKMPFESPKNFDCCNYTDFDEEPWSFVFSEDKTLLRKIQNNPLLSDIAYAKGGIITGNDSSYLFDSASFPVEKELSLDVIRTDNINRYYTGLPSLKVFYPCCRDEKGNTTVLDIDEIKCRYPKAYSHIILNEEKLKSRKDSRNTMGDKKHWYQPVRFGTLDLFNGEKILGPGIVRHNKFVIDEVGYAFSFGNMYAIVAREKTCNLRVLLGILNSSLIEFYLHKVAPVKQGGYFSYGATVLEHIPLKYPKKQQEDIIHSLVDRILSAKKADPQADTSALEAEIDHLVYDLYGLTEDEIKIVEGKSE